VTKPFFVSEFPSTVEAMGETQKRALSALIEHGWLDPSHTFYAQLCLEEALVNAVTHGNRCDAGLAVRLELIEEGETCVIRVYDHGPGFSVDSVGLPDGDTLDGRGVCLMRYCVDSVVYDTAKHCLEMRMRRNAVCEGGMSHE
jgi:anti-sigma regulatory factor (Ser/Thr protein kinase)